MQEPIDHTDKNAVLPDYRPDEGTVRLFRRMGRMGMAISVLNLVVMVFYLDLLLTYYQNFANTGAFKSPSHVVSLSKTHFSFLLALCVAYLVSSVLLFRASRGMLKFGNDPDNQNINRPVKFVYAWLAGLLVTQIINAFYFTYILLRKADYL